MSDGNLLLRVVLENQYDDNARAAYEDWLQETDPERTARVLASAGCPTAPLPHQRAFMESQALCAALCTSRYAGKTTALLLAALAGVEYPGYHALVAVPRTVLLHGAGAALEQMRRQAPRATARDRTMFVFPTGATVRFTTLASLTDVARLANSQFSFVGVDCAEMVGDRTLFEFLTRVRPPARAQVPLRVRLTGDTCPVTTLSGCHVKTFDPPG